MPSEEPYAVRLADVSKRYYLNRTTSWRLQDVIKHPRSIWKQRKGEAFWALSDVSLDVTRGEILGVIGSNGSGKSTLLRTMVGLSPPTQGTVSIHGRYAALFELSAGIHPSATGRENAYINALFMGLSKKRARELMPKILEFSGLGKFVDQPMRTYSSGMYVRLGFAVAVHVKPEILVIDEILAVGDADFQQKCFDHFAQLKQQSTTIILVSHNLATLREFADRVIHMDHGRLVNDGDPNTVIDAYMKHRINASDASRKVFKRSLEAQGLMPEETPEEATEDTPEDAIEEPAPGGVNR
jgi:ABC-type polysaccharide/polyol phosphate transport system ATPase subunit